MEDGKLGREDTFRDRKAARRRGAISEVGHVGGRERRVVDLPLLRRSVREVGLGRAVRSGVVEDMVESCGRICVMLQLWAESSCIDGRIRWMVGRCLLKLECMKSLARSRDRDPGTVTWLH